MKHPHWTCGIVVAATSLLFLAAASAGTISVNFEGLESEAGSSNLLAPADVAGLVPAANWNNISGASGAGAALVDDGGADSGVTLDWSGQATWSWERSGDTVPTNPDGTMFNGYLDTTGNDGSHTLSVTGVPYASYDVIVYIDGEHTGGDRPARVNVNPGGSGDNPALNLFTAEGANWNGTFTQATGTDLAGATSNANYARFDGLTATNFNIFAEAESFRAAINGFQIVETSVTPGLPEIANLPATNIVADAASARLDLIDNGDGADSASVTLYWGTADGGSSAAAWQNSIAAGDFSAPQSPIASPLSGLQPATTYYYRGFASNSAGDDWATDSESFSTPPALPAIANTAATGIIATGASVGGDVTSTGGETPTVRLFYGDNDGGSSEGSWDSFVDLGAQTGAYSTALSDLSHSTTYFFRGRASNSAGTAWASTSASFTTSSLDLPAVATLAATSITGISATLNGNVSDNGGDPPLVTFYYGKTDGGTDAGAWDLLVQVGTAPADFARNVSNLDPESTYFFRARATNAAGSAWASASLSFDTPVYVPPTVVINELHIDEDDKTRRGEFVELYNNSDSPIDVSGWFFSSGINQGDPPSDFVIPDGTSIDAGGYLVIAQDPAEVQAQFGYAGAIGPWVGKLSNKGETVRLNDSGGNVIDEVSYGLGWPWPTVGDEPSPSMELINPDLDNDLGGSWRSSGNIPASSGAPADYILRDDVWSYRKGLTLPADDGAGKSWQDNGYDEAADGQWLLGQAPIGRGDGDDNTVLNDMQGNYITFFMRHEFEIASGQVPPTLTLRALYDDGLVIWINGVEVHRYSVDSGAIPFPPPSGFANNHEAGDYEEVTVTGAASYLVEGTNTIAVQMINTSIGSSDATADVELVFTGSSGGGGAVDPSPGAPNSVFADNAPPAVRQVDHAPTQPTSNDPVNVTAKVTDPQGVASVSLDYQLVEPGDYIKLSDPRYDTQWTSVPMLDDGEGGDVLAGDDTYTVTLPASLQAHRRLVRYRIIASDTLGANVTGPYADDPQPNFAYFVYDGIPTWTAKATPSSPDVTYDFNALPPLQQQVPVYHLITTREEHVDSQFIPDSTRGGGYSGSDYLWEGTLVYDGEIYDHIRFRARGGVWRYSMGKNMWKFDFNRGRRFEARDQYGKRYNTDWSKLNFSAIITQGNFNRRGEQGLFEWGGFKLHNLADNPAPKTHYAHFRIIEHADENGSTNSQFDTDFQGLYLAVEQLDGQFVEEHGLPDGYLWKIEGNNNQDPPNSQGSYLESDYSNGDVDDFISGYRSGSPSADWWKSHLDLPNYYSFRAMATAIHDYDIHAGKNYFYFHNPETDKWQVVNWDLDLTWTTPYRSDPGGPLEDDVLAIPEFARDYRNRLREIVDLVFNDDQTGKILDECARFVHTPGMPSLVDADRAMWDYNPILTSSYINNSKAGHGRFYQAASPRTFAGMLEHTKAHVATQTNNPINSSFLNNEENDIPATPTISYVGGAGFPANELTFRSSNFSDPQGAGEFAGMQWRIGEIYYDGVSGYVAGEAYRYEIEEVWTSEVQSAFTQGQTVPLIYARAGRTYRARVRHLDTDGNWGHWSDPLEFTVTAPDVSFYQQSLVISELMYKPAGASAAELGLGFSTSDFEWIEVSNVGAQAVDMTDLRFTKGVDFDFPASYNIPPGGYAILARNQAAFGLRYGDSHPVVGSYAPDSLSNDGENLKLSFGAGVAIVEFTYNDVAPWPTAADTGGISLVLIDPDSLPDHALPTSWRASSQTGGTPGPDPAGLTFDGWKIATGVTGDAGDDDDTDRFDNLLEYGTGSDALDPASANYPTASVETIGASDYLIFKFQKRIGADDLTYSIEISPDLSTWSPLDATFISSAATGDGITTTETWRSNHPIPPTTRDFARLRITN